MWRALLIPLLCWTLMTGADPNPIVKTNFGFLRGKWIDIRNPTIAAFLGVPYAEPPVDDQRFKSPVPWDTEWTETRNATEDGPMCMQLDSSSNAVGDEDCLYLNVFTPQVSEEGSYNETYPVLVFVHGGGFETGSSDSNLYGPEYLLRSNIILVTLNYRLGYLGFMSTYDENSPGNNGLKDIIAALRWVQSNVESFGGNPEAVTLDGHGAGAAAVHHLVLSEKSEGLFHRYVLQSGSGQAPWAFQTPEINRNLTLQIAEQLNCTAENNREVIECLREVNATDILQASISKRVVPTVEPDFEDAVLTEHPKILMREREMRNFPHIVGVTRDEGLQQTFEDSLEKSQTKSNLSEIKRYVSVYKDVVKDFPAFAEELSSFYFDKRNISETNSQMTQLVGDALVIWPVYEAMRKLSYENNETQTYFYYFGYMGTFGWTMKYDKAGLHGASHMDDINYIFPYFNHFYADARKSTNSDDDTMVNILTEMWTTFTTYGIPKAGLVPTWQTYEQNHCVMRFGYGTNSTPWIEYNFLHERMAFWKKLMTKYELPISPYRIEETNGGSSLISSPLILPALLIYIFL